MPKAPGRVALVMVLLAGCAASTWDIDKYAAAGTNVATLGTFAWGGGELGSAAAIDPSVVQAADRRIRETIVADLQKKGYTLAADPATAQMVVSYQVVGSRVYVTSNEPRFNAPSPDAVLSASAPPMPAASELPPERRVTEGSVVVFFDEPASKKLLWRGSITAETRSANSTQAIETASKMASDILKSFPNHAP